MKAKFGIDYENLRQINPRIVYGSISGFGQDGPYHTRPGFDQLGCGEHPLANQGSHPDAKG